MAYHPPPNEPTPQEDAFNQSEPPASQVNRPPEEAPTRRQAAYPRPPQMNQPSPQQQGYPRPPEANAPAIRARAFWSELSLLGQVAGVAGLLLLIFFFLPWSFTPDVSAASTPITNRFSTSSHSGWATAAGIPLLGGATSFNLFPQLWLVLASALALIVIAVLLGRQRVSTRLAALLMTLIALFALLLEILFLVQINSFQEAINALAGGRLNQTLYGVSWGFWIGLAATIVALGMGSYMLYQEYAPGAPRTPQATRLPGEQQPYPTA